MRMKRMAMALAGIFFVSACATTQYVPKQTGMIRMMPSGYQKDDRVFRGDGKLMKAVESDEEALRYAKKARKNGWWAKGLLWGGLGTYLAGCLTFKSNQPDSSSRNQTAISLVGVGLVSLIAGIFPELAAKADRIDAINKYNDGVLQKQTPEIFNEGSK